MAVCIVIEAQWINKVLPIGFFPHELTYRVFLRKPADQRIIVPGTEVVQAGFSIVVFPTVAEGVGIVFILSALITECVVIVILRQFTVGIGQLHYIAVGIVEIIPSPTEDQVDATDVGVNLGAFHLADDISTIKEVMCRHKANRSRRSDPLRVVGVDDRPFTRDGGYKLIQPIVSVANDRRVVHIQLRQQISVVIVGVGDQDIGSRLVADLADEPVVGVVGVGGGVGWFCVPTTSTHRTGPCAPGYSSPNGVVYYFAPIQRGSFLCMSYVH